MDDWVQVHNANWLHEAQLVKALLEAEGIEASIPDEHTIGVHSLLTTMLGGARVLVRASDEARAREVLRSADPTVLGVDDESR